MFKYCKMFGVIAVIFFSSKVFADADDWSGSSGYGQNYGYAPVVQEQFFVTPQGQIVEEEIIATRRGLVEKEIVYAPQPVIEYQQVQPIYRAPPTNYNQYGQPFGVYGNNW